MRLNKITLSIILLIYADALLMAQDTKKPDYIVLYNLDTLYGKVDYINEEGVHRKFYQKLRLTTADGKRKKYKKEDVMYFCKDNNLFQSFWLSQTSKKVMIDNPRYHILKRKGNHHFLKVIKKGKLSYYELEWFEQGNTTLFHMALLKKEKDSYLIRVDQGLLGLKRKVIHSYFSDCPKIQEAVNKKKLEQIWEIVDFYNSYCNS